MIENLIKHLGRLMAESRCGTYHSFGTLRIDDVDDFGTARDTTDVFTVDGQ